MLIELINGGTARLLLTAVEQANKQNISLGVLHFMGSQLPLKPLEDEVLQVIRPVVEERSAKLYVFEDGDYVITWTGRHTVTLAGLYKALYSHYAPEMGETGLHAYYDAVAHGEEVRAFCRKRLEASPSEKAAPAAPPPAEAPRKTLNFQPSYDQLRNFQAAVARRAQRKKPKILVVEDQAFSRKLLIDLLSQQYSCTGVATVEAALEFYWTEAPDLVLLDIELPDASGHELAAVLNGLDPDAYIVMVTGNHQASDVLQARQNKAKGFIVKPYSRQKITECMAKFVADRKAGKA